jgi:hypothetical protein
MNGVNRRVTYGRRVRPLRSIHQSSHIQMIRTGLAYILYHVGDTVYKLYNQKGCRLELYWLYNWLMIKSSELDIHDRVWKHFEPDN